MRDTAVMQARKVSDADIAWAQSLPVELPGWGRTCLSQATARVGGPRSGLSLPWASGGIPGVKSGRNGSIASSRHWCPSRRPDPRLQAGGAHAGIQVDQRLRLQRRRKSHNHRYRAPAEAASKPCLFGRCREHGSECAKDANYSFALFGQNQSAGSRLMSDQLAEAALRWQRKVLSIL